MKTNFKMKVTTLFLRILPGICWYVTIQLTMSGPPNCIDHFNGVEKNNQIMYQTCKRLDSDDSFQSLPVIYFSWILFKQSDLLLQTFLLVKLVLMQIRWLMRIDAMGLEFLSSQCSQWLTDYNNLLWCKKNQNIYS